MLHSSIIPSCNTAGHSKHSGHASVLWIGPHWLHEADLIRPDELANTGVQHASSNGKSSESDLRNMMFDLMLCNVCSCICHALRPLQYGHHSYGAYSLPA